MIRWYFLSVGVGRLITDPPKTKTQASPSRVATPAFAYNTRQITSPHRTAHHGESLTPNSFNRSATNRFKPAQLIQAIIAQMPSPEADKECLHYVCCH